MKTMLLKNCLYLLISLILFTGFSLNAQDKKNAPKEKTEPKTIQIKMIKIEKNGKKVTIDTTLTTNEQDEKALIKKLEGLVKDSDKQKKMEFIIDGEFPGLSELDSIEEQITMTVDPEEEFLYVSPDGESDFYLFDNEYLSSPDKCNGSHSDGLCSNCKMHLQLQNNFQPYQFLSPTDIITKFNIRKKRNGKKIVIKTKNGEFPSMFPVPPPPCPPGCKKIIMMNDGSSPKTLDNNMNDMKVKVKILKQKEKEIKDQQKQMLKNEEQMLLKEQEKLKEFQEKLQQEKQDKETK